MKRIATASLTVAVVIGVLFTGCFGAPPTAPPAPAAEFETFSKYGFSFKYPKQMPLTEEGHPLFGGEASETSGMVYGRRDNSDHEILTVMWFTVVEEPSLEAGLAGGREGMKQGEEYTNLVFGDIIESEISGHRMIYEPQTYKYSGDQVYRVVGAWYCDVSRRSFQVLVMYSEEDVLPLFHTYIDSLVCH